MLNRNTIPGDKNSLDPSGIRMGTPWITQRGFDERKSRILANIMADVLLACAPHSVDTPHKGKQRRAKVDFKVLNAARLKVRALAESAGIDFKYKEHGYPHFYYIDDKSKKGSFKISGHRARQFLDYALSSDLSALKPGESQPTKLFTPTVRCALRLLVSTPDAYRLSVPVARAGIAGAWLRDLSDGYVSFNFNGKPDFDPGASPGR